MTNQDQALRTAIINAHPIMEWTSVSVRFSRGLHVGLGMGKAHIELEAMVDAHNARKVR